MTSTPKPRNARDIYLGVSLGVVCGVHQDFIEDFVQRRDLEPKKGGTLDRWTSRNMATVTLW